MKRAFLFVICFISKSYAQETKDYFISIDSIVAGERNAYSRIANVKNTTSASENFDISYYRCEWKVNPAARYITGKVTSYFIITSPANTISFDLSDSLLVDSVKQKNIQLPFKHTNNTVTISFKNTEEKGLLDSVSIYYNGIPPNTGFGSFVTTAHAGVPVMWTLSEPYGSRDWWPCKNGLNDKADSIDVIITAPSTYKAASNGIRIDEVINGTNTTTHWKHRYPIASYLICMAVTNYAELNDSVQIGNVQLPMQTFSYPESIAAWQANTPLVLGTMQFYSNVFGDYPFIKEKYGHVQFSWGGGEEHQTSTFIVKPQDLLMAHELAHQWFGDKITCGSWRDIWLNEGFATHLSVMDYERKYPQLADTNRKKENIIITSLPGGSVWVDDTTNVKRIFDARLTYYKGSHLLFMLRWKLGDSTFFKGIRRYLNDSSISFGFATTNDLKRNLEAVSGINLTEFFKDWFYGQGYPSYNVQWTPVGNDYVKINISQTTSDSSVKFFPLPVALKFKNATQEKIIVVDNKYNGEISFNNIGFVADTVIVDPDYWLTTSNNVSKKVADNTNGENVVQVFPNPFVNSFTLYLHHFDTSNAFFKIYDVAGKLMYYENFFINGSLYKVINPRLTSKGVYFINLQTDKGFKFVKKILKQ